MSVQRSRTDRWRDTIAWALASAAMGLASPWYRKMIQGAIRYGLEAAARDAYAQGPGRKTLSPEESAAITAWLRKKREADK